MEIQDFIEKYMEGEPLTTDSIAYAIKKFVYCNYSPTKQQKLEGYENILWELAKTVKENNVDKQQQLLKNIHNWALARAMPQEDEDEKLCIENETFYNLSKTM